MKLRQLIVAAIVRRQSSILMVREQRNSRAQWNLPGGRVEAGETMTAALRREVREETGQEIERVAHVAYVVESQGPGTSSGRRIACVFEVEVKDGPIAVGRTDAVDRAMYVDVQEARDLLADSILPTREPLRAYLDGSRGAGAHWNYVDEGSGQFRREG